MGLFLAWLAAGCVCGDAPRFQVVTTVLPSGIGKAKGTGGHSQESHVLAKNTSTPSHRLRLIILNSNTVVEDNLVYSECQINQSTNNLPSTNYH